MANTNLNGKKVAILATDGFEQSELTEPRKALDAAGAMTKVVSPKAGQIQGMKHQDPGEKVKVDMELKSANPSDFDALLLPGGVANPDSLRMDDKAVAFVRHFVESGKPIGYCVIPFSLIFLASATSSSSVLGMSVMPASAKCFLLTSMTRKSLV